MTATAYRYWRLAARAHGEQSPQAYAAYQHLLERQATARARAARRLEREAGR